MTTPDSQARTLRDAIERQQRTQDVARETALEIARERDAEQSAEKEGDAP